MKSKKTLATSLVFALALGSLPFTGFGLQSAKAAGITANFDAVSGLVKVADTNTTPVVWGVAKKMRTAPKAGKEKSTQKRLGEKDWYEIKVLEEAFAGEIDAYAVSKGKEVNLVVIKKDKQNNKELGAEDFTLVELKGPDKNFKVVYSADGKGLDLTDNKIAGDENSGYLAFFKSDNTGKKAEQFLPTGEDVQLKKGKNGMWKDLKFYFEGNTFADEKGDKRVAALVQNGSELSFRLKPASNTKGWMSKEVKVKVAKRPNAPKIKVDVNKDIITLKKGMKYKVMLGENELQGETEFVDPKKNTFTDLKIKTDIAENDKDKQQTIEVKTVGKGKKLTSKSSKIVLKRQDAPTVAHAIKDNKDLKKQGGSIIQKGDGESKPELVTLNLSTPYDPSKGATLENKDTTKDYEFWIGYDDQDTTPDKWNILKKAKDEDKPTKVKLKTSDIKKKGTFKVDGSSTSKIHIRVAGDNKTSADVVTLPSSALEVNLKMSKLDQAVKKQSDGDSSGPVTVSGNASTFEAKFKSQLDYSFSIFVKDLVNAEAKPKLANVSKVDGVSVKAEAFDGTNDETNGSKSVITLKVANEKKAEAMENKQLSFDFLVEGVKVKFTLTLKKGNS